MMLDGNSAALRDEEQRQSFIDSVFAAKEAEAVRQLTEEAVAKFAARDVGFGDIYDFLDKSAEASLVQAIELDDSLECLRLLTDGREKALAFTRRQWVELHTEERVWALYNRGE